MVGCVHANLVIGAIAIIRVPGVGISNAIHGTALDNMPLRHTIQPILD